MPAHDGHAGADVHGHVPQHMKPLPLPSMKQSADTRTWQLQMLARGWRGIGTANGVFGDKAQNVCRAFQAEKGLPVTGTVDEATWALTWSAPITP
jgi:peptidoglycan hydrolase-like protein with peptidoglycan-binding domain